MGLRIRKSVDFGLFRLNASKSGLGWSVGGPGARYTKMANGRKRTTLSIPGTGISWVEETKSNPKKAEMSGWDILFEILGGILLGIACIFGIFFSALNEVNKK